MNRIILMLMPFLFYSQVFSHGISEDDKQRMIDGGYFQYIGLGATHMLTGYDHLLFLFGVIFFLTKFTEIVRFISAFTLGHSITLIFATFMEISVNYFLIDAVIALTVIYKGFDNIGGFKKYLKCNSPNLTFLVFVFGLIHGFGLSTRLQQLPLGDEGLLLKIISFNIGVEFGQIIGLTIMVLVLSRWRKSASFLKFSTISNVGLMIVGALLFFMQMHGYTHETFVDELAFSTDSHLLDHDNSKKNEISAESESMELVGDWKDTVKLIIPSGKSLEYKFHILKDQIFYYSWKTKGNALFFDFHGDPKGGGQFQSYKKGTESSSEGSLKLPFEGSHGWFWKNTSDSDIEVILNTKGSYEIIGKI